MKKFIFVVTALLLCVFSLRLSVYPINLTLATALEPTYLRVINNSTPFYKSPTDTNALFFLPYTYYVKVISTENAYVHVECYGSGDSIAIDGYVPTGILFEDNLPVKNPYLDLTVTTAKTAVLYAEPSLTTSIQYVFPERNLTYLGEYPTLGEKLYFVSYNERLGYVKESDVYPFSITNHPNELTFIQPEEPEQPKDDTKTNTSSIENYFSLKIIIVVCLLFAGIVGLFIALKQKPNRSVSVGYYDENDYE